MLALSGGCGRSGETSRAPVPPAATGTESTGHQQRADDRAPREPLLIAAASDLQAALPKLADRFGAQTGAATSLTYGASGQLAQQIRGGVPFDVFMSANQAFVRELALDGLNLTDSVHPYARGSLALAVFREKAGQVRALGDLTKSVVTKIALANPAVAPYGLAAKQALRRAGLWEKVEPKIVIAVTVRQALVYVQNGNAEAGLIGRAIANVPEIQAFDVDTSLYDPIVEQLGILASSRRVPDARRFIEFVMGAEAEAVLREFGFKPGG
jgi:molybdate transport system substrate-binding protein